MGNVPPESHTGGSQPATDRNKGSVTGTSEMEDKMSKLLETTLIDEKEPLTFTEVGRHKYYSIANSYSGEAFSYQNT